MSVTSPEGPSSRAFRTEAAEPSLAPGQGHGDSSEPIAPLPSRYAGQIPELANEAIWLREQREGLQDPCVTTDLEALLTALYVKIDDEIGGTRWMGTPPLLSDSELVCLAVAQALLGYHSEARWLRYANRRMSGMFPLPAAAAGLQQAPAIRAPADQAHDQGAGDGQRLLVRQPLDSRLDTGSVRDVASGRAAIEPGRVGAVRLLRVTFPVLLGTSALPGVHAHRDAGHVGAGAREGILLISDKGFASRPFERELLDQASSCCGPRASARRSGTASRCSKRSAS